MKSFILTSHRCVYIICQLVFFGLMCAFLSTPIVASAQSAPTLIHKEWNVGDSWVVKVALFDRGDIMPHETPRWLEPQSWLFQVVENDIISNESYKVILITPQAGNHCPYIFKFWFRQQDMYVARYEIISPEVVNGKKNKIKAGVVRKDLPVGDAWPFVMSEGVPSASRSYTHFQLK